MIRKSFAIFVSIAFLAVVVSAQQTSTGTSDHELRVDDETRTYRLHVPASYATHEERVPLVLFLHGRGGSGAQASRGYGFREKADREGFVVAYPDALGTPRTWRAPYFPGEGDADVRFLDALIDEIGKHHRIDERRIYCTGHSSGGIMSYAVGGHLSHRIAAIGVVAGSAGFLVGGVPSQVVHAPEHPVSLIAFHGTDDALIPYDQEAQKTARYGFFLPTQMSVGTWARQIWATEKEDETLADGKLRITRYLDPATSRAAILYTIVGGGHGWPSRSRILGRAPIEATDAIWSFFAEHPRSETLAFDLFDGETLDGWEGDARYWRVEDGAIVGESTAETPCTSNTFLIWKKGTVKDFELTFEFAIDSGNSGVQFRSRRLDGFAVGGYQADMEAGPNWTGGLYDERGKRGILTRRGQSVTVNEDGSTAVTTFADGASLERDHIEKQGWTRARVRAVGRTIEISMGNHLMSRLVDHEKHAVLEGILALQVHAGAPMKVRFRKLRLQHLP
ncbi:MAG: DUF1080 domain-containing protein [Planctomycetes bacterium]|nr:DUF1080 domain-containing protein [Planctomycetota bacterium]